MEQKINAEKIWCTRFVVIWLIDNYIVCFPSRPEGNYDNNKENQLFSQTINLLFSPDNNKITG